MFNFLDPKLLPKVTCTAPTMDNFEATNLISDNCTLKTRGFISYSVIKPPVDLDFEFLCPVNVSFISLMTTVGRQKCTGIEIFATMNDSDFTSIGKAFYDNNGLIFCDSRKYSKTQLPPAFSNDTGLFFLNKAATKVWKNATKLKVRIFRTYKSVPCMASIQVYGEPSQSCSETTKQTINKLMGINVTRSRKVPDGENWNRKKENTIPEDFRDALTMQLMTIPMTLPSGKTVDRETLEKHVENEASFCRKPGDPFTGLPFTDTRKPVINVALKSRIDMFLLKNSKNSWTFPLKRTLGGSQYNSKRLKFCDVKCWCGNDETLYRISCDHFICKNCLNLEKFVCETCNKGFKSSDVEKFNK